MARSLMHCLLGSLIAAGLALAAPVEEHHEKRAPQIASISNTLPLRKESYQQKEGSSPSSVFRNHRALNFNIAADDPEAAHNGKALAARNQIAYITDVKAGPGTYQLIIDTGSSDTWFVKKGFQCRNYRKQPIPLEQCMFGPEFQGDFPGGKIAGQRFSIAYGDGNGPYLQGEMGYSDMTVSGMTVPKQQIALATTGAWDGDGVTSGILGLGLPALTEAFNGTSDNAANLVTYDPFVTTVVKQDVPPIFSLALARESNRSFLSFGGVPPEAKTDGNWATTKILKLERVSGGSDYFYYTIQPDGFVWNTPSGTNQTARSPMIIVDSGTTLNLLPYQIAQAINNAFVPRAALDSQMGGWFVPCDAKAPDLGVTIGGKTIWTNPSNMILPQVRHPITGECATGIGATNGFPYILGDTFMQELVSVFDISDKMELRFAKRTD